MISNKLFFTLVAVTTVLTGCGGGSSSSDQSNSQNEVTCLETSANGRSSLARNLCDFEINSLLFLTNGETFGAFTIAANGQVDIGSSGFGTSGVSIANLISCRAPATPVEQGDNNGVCRLN